MSARTAAIPVSLFAAFTLLAIPALADPTPKLVPPNRAVPAAKYRLGYTGVFTGDGMIVRQVLFGSFAQRMGLERGDVVIAVNGQAIRSYIHYLQLLNSSAPDLELTVRDVRTGDLVLLSISLHWTAPQTSPARPVIKRQNDGELVPD